MATSVALVVGVAVAGLFVLIIAVVIVAFCVYLHQNPSRQLTTRVKKIKTNTSNTRYFNARRKYFLKSFNDTLDDIYYVDVDLYSDMFEYPSNNKEKLGENETLQKANGKTGRRIEGQSGRFGVCECTCCYGARDQSIDDRDVAVTTETIVVPVDQQVVPQPPEDIELEDPDAREVTITWSVSDRDNVERFQIFKRLAKKSSPWTKIKTLKKPNATRCRLNKLDCDVKYMFGVAAKNAVGRSTITQSVSIILKQKPVLPGPPSELVTWQKSGTTLTLSWKPPKLDGHLRILRYHISMLDDNAEWVQLTRLQAFERFMDYRVTGLSQNVPYRFRIAAENDIGVGPSIETKDVILHNGPVPPDKPKGPLHYADITHNSISVSWQEPAHNAEHPISGYAIELLDANQEKWKKVGTVPMTKKRFWISKLSEDCYYFARVVAISNVGNSQPLTGPKFKTKLLEIPLNQRSSVSRLHNISRGQSRGTPGPGRSVQGSPVKGLRSLNTSGILSRDFDVENQSSTNHRARVKRSRSGKQRNVANTFRTENETGNDVNYSARSRKYGQGAGQAENIDSVDVGVETMSGGLAMIDIGVETDHHRSNILNPDNISTDLSSVSDKPNHGKFHYLNNTIHTNVVPSNESYSFR